MTRVLVTGSTGYIGRRLVRRLLAGQDFHLRLLVRNRREVSGAIEKLVEIVEGDFFDPEALVQALVGIEIAFYLVHPVEAGRELEPRERLEAEIFREACIAAGIKRIICLGGLDAKGTASRHLRSRLGRGEILSARPDAVQTLWLRAGMIIGSGSAAFEIISHLVRKLPVMITPRWADTRAHPIGVEDVLAFLEKAVHLQATENLIIDLGATPLTFREMLYATARVVGRKRLIIGVPLVASRLSSYWLALFTPVPYRVAAMLVEGLRVETVLQNDHARRYFPEIVPRPFGQAVLTAMAETEGGQVVSRWCDSSDGAACDMADQDDTGPALLIDRRSRDFGELAPEEIFKAATSVGGQSGWFRYHFLWSLRGGLDKLAGGYGLTRGRRHQQELRVGDALDFWKVVELVPNQRLLLLAQMKVPGKAWLEFTIEGRNLVQTAYFYPRGVWGRVYWYLTTPLHHLVFEDLVSSIVGQARRRASGHED